jgi:hypothetical protein
LCEGWRECLRGLAVRHLDWRQGRLTPLTPDRQDTQTLRAWVRARKDLVGHRLAVANQLRAKRHLQSPARRDGRWPGSRRRIRPR